MDRLTKRSNFLSPPEGEGIPEYFRKRDLKMKKFLCVLMAMAMILSLAACGGSSEEAAAETEAAAAEGAVASGV